jgi:hypothetical protein
MDEADLVRFTEEVLSTLASFRDRKGLKIRLSADQEIQVLAAAITVVNNVRTDINLFRTVEVGFDGLIGPGR